MLLLQVDEKMDDQEEKIRSDRNAAHGHRGGGGETTKGRSRSCVSFLLVPLMSREPHSSFLSFLIFRKDSSPSVHHFHPFSHQPAEVTAPFIPPLTLWIPSAGTTAKIIFLAMIDRRCAESGIMRKHKQAVRGNIVFKCPQPGCEYSSSSKSNVAIHLEGFHGTARSFACDHPGCTFRSSWRTSIARHRHVHSDERPFVCDHTGCSFRTKRKTNLSIHKNSVHLNIRYNRCHVCEKEFRLIWQLKAHMLEHEEQGHKFDKCQDCSVNLRSKLSRKTKPTAGKPVLCGHPGCNFKSKWKCRLSSHKKQVHRTERNFSCDQTGCSFRCKIKSGLTTHQKRVHLKIRTKWCHVCDKRFFDKSELRAHMMSQHQTKDHEIDECDDCVSYLKRNHEMSQAQTASCKMKAGKNVTQSNPANKSDVVYYKKKSGREEGISFAVKKEQVKSETTGSLNEDLIDVHMDMQLLSLF